jgi:hypothetical protein
VKPRFALRLIAVTLIPLGFLGCAAASSPNSEVMIDTSTQKKQSMTASQLRDPNLPNLGSR